jgi:hypothetical protein
MRADALSISRIENSLVSAAADAADLLATMTFEPEPRPARRSVC